MTQKAIISGPHALLDWAIAWFVVAVALNKPAKTLNDILGFLTSSPTDGEPITDEHLRESLAFLTAEGWLATDGAAYSCGPLTAARRFICRSHEVWSLVKADDPTEDTWVFMVQPCDRAEEFVSVTRFFSNLNRRMVGSFEINSTRSLTATGTLTE